MRKLLGITVVMAVASGASALQPDRTLESTGSAAGQNIRIASGANAAGDYGVVVGSNVDAAAGTQLFAVCEDCDAVTPTYVFTVLADGSWTLDATAPLLTTASSAAGLNFGLASGANAAGEYGVVVGSTAVVTDGTQLFAVASDVDGTPAYVFTVAANDNVLLGATVPLVTTASSATGLNLGIASGANASGEYGVVVGTTDTAVITGQGLFAVAADVDGTPIYTLEVQPVGVTGVGAQVLNTSSAAALNLAIYSGANAAGEYAVTVGSSATVTDGTQLFGVASDVDGTEAYVFTVSADDNVLLGATAPVVSTVSTQAGINLVLASGADAAGEYGVSAGSNATGLDASAPLMPLFSVGQDLDGTPEHLFELRAGGGIFLDGSGTPPTSVASGSGTAAVTALSITGQDGGAVTTAVGAISGGTGGSMSFASGAGGAASGASTTNTGGTAGSFEFIGAVGGAASLAGTNNGGSGSNVIFTAGNGGTGASTGGGGGTIDLISGNGAATNGAGGNITLTTGSGNGSGADGRIILASIWDQAGQGVRVASGADAAGDYGVVAGTNAIVSDGTQAFAVCTDCDGVTPVYVLEVAASGAVDHFSRVTGNVTVNLRDYADSADDDMAHVVLSANCTDTGTGTEDCDYTVGVVEAGAAAETRFEINADAGITLGSSNNDSFTVTTDGTGDGEVVLPGESVSGAEMVLDTVDGAQLADTLTFDTTLLGMANGATGVVALNFHDYADTADDDMVHVALTSNCDDVGTGTEDCDFSIGVVEAGAAADTRFNIDADAGVTVGSANNNSFTVTTDGTGDGEVVLPGESVSGAEMVLDTVDGAQLADTITFDTTLLGLANAATGDVTLNWHDYADSADDDMAHVVMTTNCTDVGTGTEDCDFSIGVVEAGAAAETRFSIDADAGVTIGSANTNSVTLTTSATGDAALVLPAGGVSGTELLDGTVEAVDEAFAGRGQIVICGTLDTISSNTVYYGPNTAVSATGVGGMTCDTTAVGNTTEATADEPAFAARAFHVRGMVCRNADTNVTSVVYALRTAGGATTPDVTCSVGDGVLDCVADVQTTTAIASGATIAIAATEADEAVGAVAFVCTIDIAY